MSFHGNNWMSSPLRRPTLEVLESRSNPSTVHFNSGTLVIIGTRGDDTVAIVDDGDGGLQVTFDNTAGGGGGSHQGSGGSGSNGSNNSSNGSNDSDGGG